MASSTINRILGRRASTTSFWRPLWALAIILFASLGMAGCSPQFDWRELSAADGVLRIAFPGKPRSETRQLPIAGIELPFTLAAVEAGGSLFAVGYIDLPPEVVKNRDDAQDYIRTLEESLTRNLQGEQTARNQVQIRYAYDPGRAPLAADEFEVHGNPAGQPMWLLGRVLLVGNRLIEVAAIGAEKTLTRETARTFVDSMRLQ